MKDYQLTRHTLPQFFEDIQTELEKAPLIIVSTQDSGTGKWGMARLWRDWMTTTTKRMVAAGVTMPLCVGPTGESFGSRTFTSEDAHELYTYKWLGVDADGKRLRGGRQARDGMRPATKGERYIALLRHENYCTDKGILLLKPRGSEYEQLADQQEQ